MSETVIDLRHGNFLGIHLRLNRTDCHEWGRWTEWTVGGRPYVVRLPSCRVTKAPIRDIADQLGKILGRTFLREEKVWNRLRGAYYSYSLSSWREIMCNYRPWAISK